MKEQKDKMDNNNRVEWVHENLTNLNNALFEFIIGPKNFELMDHQIGEIETLVLDETNTVDVAKISDFTGDFDLKKLHLNFKNISGNFEIDEEFKKLDFLDISKNKIKKLHFKKPRLMKSDEFEFY